MSTEKHIQEFDELIREMASGAETLVPPSVWEGVSSGTSSAAGAGAAGAAGKAIIAKWAAIVGGAAIVVTAAVTLLKDNAEIPSVQDETAITQTQEGETTDQVSPVIIVEEHETSGSDQNEGDASSERIADSDGSQVSNNQSSSDDGDVETGETVDQGNSEAPDVTDDSDKGDDTPGDQHGDVPHTLNMSNVVCVGSTAEAVLTGENVLSDGVQWWLDGKLVAVGGVRNNFYFPRAGKHRLILRFTDNGHPAQLEHVIDVQRTNASIVSESEKGRLILRAQGDVAQQSWFINNTEVEAIDGVVEYECENYSDHDVVLIAESDNGCMDTIEKVVECSWEDKIDFDAGDIFSPYIKDGKNDVFEVRLDPVKSYHMQIRSNSGQLVFETTDQTEYWNGQLMNNGEMLPEGRYNYVLKYSNGGKEETRYGRLLLVK